MTALALCFDRPDYLPRLSPQHLLRSRLAAPLVASSARVKLLCAPAGSGKSALLSECARQAEHGCQVCWLPLGASNSLGRQSDPAELAAQLAAALGLMEKDQASVLAHFATRRTVTWLFLDDYSRQPSPALDAFLDRLLAQSSPAVTWWISARRHPQCNWPRLLLNGELQERDSTALAFNVQEIQQLLCAQGLDDRLPNASRLAEQTAGWCAGVRMGLLEPAAWACPSQHLAYQASPFDQDPDNPQPENYRCFAMLGSYLDHELFAGLSAELAEAWRVLAHLPRFCPSLCEHLFGSGEGAQWLKALLEQGCFVVASENDSPPDCFEIFAPLARYVRQQPWPAGRSWHRRACQWFVGQGDWQGAVEQALQAGQLEVAVSLLQHFGPRQLFERQNVVLLLRLHEQLEDDVLMSNPHLLCLFSGALIISGRLDQAALCINELARFTPQPSAHRQREVIARWQALQGCLDHLSGNAAQARLHLRAALENLPEEMWESRLLCLSNLTQQALLDSDLDQATSYNREALCLARARDCLVFEAWVELDHAQLLEQHGAFERSDELLAKIHDLLVVQNPGATLVLGRLDLRRGRLAISMGHDDEARAFLRSGLQASLQCQDKRALYGFLGLALLDANHGDYGSAFSRLRDAERLMQQHQVPETVYRGVLVCLSSHFWLQQGRIGLAHEALTRLGQHYLGENAIQAPPASLLLVPRIKYLLILVAVYQGQGHAAPARLRALYEEARESACQGLMVECSLVLSEVHYLQGHTAAARQTLAQALALAKQLGLQQPLKESRLRQPQLWQEPGLLEQAGQVADSPLSLRELEVLRLVALGLSNLQIADQLFISLHTVKTHARRIHTKLGVERRTQAVAKAKAMGLMV